MRNTTPEWSEIFRQPAHRHSANKETNVLHFSLFHSVFLITRLPFTLLLKACLGISHWACAKHACQNSSAEGLNRFTFSQVHIGGSAGWVVGVYLARRSIGSSRVSAAGCIGAHTQKHTCPCLLRQHSAWWAKAEGKGKESKTGEMFESFFFFFSRGSVSPPMEPVVVQEKLWISS